MMIAQAARFAYECVERFYAWQTSKLLKRLNTLVLIRVFLWLIAWSNRKYGFHSGLASGRQFTHNVGNKKYLFRRKSDRLCDATVAFDIVLLTDSGVEVVVDKWSEIARFSVPGKKLLGQYTAGRKDIY